MQDTVIDTLQMAPDTTLNQVVVEVPPIGLFTEHQLQVDNGMEELERTGMGNGLVLGLFLLCALIAVYLQRNSDNLFASVFKASFDQNQTIQDARVENSQRKRNLFLLNLISFVTISLFVTGVLLKLFGLNQSVKILFSMVLGIFAAFFIVKRLIVWLLSKLFLADGIMKFQRYNLNIFLAILGLFLLPVVAILFFSPQVPIMIPCYLGLALICFFYLKGLYRGLMLSFGPTPVSPLHLFYYFCALEILPVFVLIRFAQTL